MFLLVQIFDKEKIECVRIWPKKKIDWPMKIANVDAIKQPVVPTIVSTKATPSVTPM